MKRLAFTFIFKAPLSPVKRSAEQFEDTGKGLELALINDLEIILVSTFSGYIKHSKKMKRIKEQNSTLSQSHNPLAIYKVKHLALLIANTIRIIWDKIYRIISTWTQISIEINVNMDKYRNRSPLTSMLFWPLLLDWTSSCFIELLYKIRISLLNMLIYYKSHQANAYQWKEIEKTDKNRMDDIYPFKGI